jgi:predicted DNA-binding transcriptional regulator AlpA
MDEKLLTPGDLEALLGKPKAALANWRYQGLGPRFIKLGPKAVRYRAKDVESWLDQQTRQQTGAAA